MFKEVLMDRLRQALGLWGPRIRKLPVLDLSDPDPSKKPFSQWLSAFLTAFRKKIQPAEMKRLLVCLDGLDEAPPPLKDEFVHTGFFCPPSMIFPRASMLLITFPSGRWGARGGVLGQNRFRQ